jgi:uncharacterized protein
MWSSFCVSDPCVQSLSHNIVNNPNVRVGPSRFGIGLFAATPIAKDEMIVEFEGPILQARMTSELPDDDQDYAVQIGPNQWTQNPGIGRRINHSCEPNCGIRGTTTIVAMRDLLAGEELTFDYEMTECSDWRMQCQCGSPLCRGTIGTYLNLPQEIREKYKGYISMWLTNPH